MLAYVDESGCTGMRIEDGATPFFTVTAVLFNDRADSQACYDHIDKLRVEIRVAKEFHFSKLSHEKRERFFKEVADFPFRYVAVGFDKARIIGQGLVLSQSFLQFQVNAIFAAVAAQMGCKLDIEWPVVQR